MEYKIGFYEKSSDNLYRYVLGKRGEDPLVVIGLNPRTADDREPDQTIKKVMGFMTRNSKDSFIMLNLCAERATEPVSLSKELDIKHHKENLIQIENILKKFPKVDILMAYGDKINVRSYLNDCLHDLIKMTNNYNVNFYKVGELTQKGFPRHLSRVVYDKLTEFDMGSF